MQTVRAKSCFVLLLIVVANYELGASAADLQFVEQKLKEYMSCFDFSCFNRKTTWTQWSEYVNPCLAPAGVWHSTKNLKGSAIPLTVITQLSMDRLQQLAAQCDSWQGPLVASIHLGILQSYGEDVNSKTQEVIGKAIQDLQALFNSAESGELSCQLTMVLFYEIYAEKRATLLYPVNSLRNYARLLADTELIANIDVDMLLSDNLSELMQQSEEASALISRIKKQKSVVVLPAFEQNPCSNPEASALHMTLATKPGLASYINAGCADMYAKKAFFGGHNATDYSRWFQTTQPYSVPYVELYEPWYISDRFSTHWYDVRYRGYGKNKIMQVTNMNISGFRFDIHPQAFILHKIHTKSVAKLEYVNIKDSVRKIAVDDARIAVRGSMFEKVERMYIKHRWQMKTGKYTAKTDTVLVKCLDKLSWWRDHHEPSRWLPAWAWTLLDAKNSAKYQPNTTAAASGSGSSVTSPQHLRAL